MAEEIQEKKYEEFDMSKITRSGSGSDYADYVTLEADEPYEAFVQDIKLGTKFNKQENAEKPRVFTWCEVTQGPGKGQRYRADFNPKISPAGSKKPTDFSKFLDLVYGEHVDAVDKNDLLGRTIRIELSEPWGDKGLQFIKTFKVSKSGVERVDVAQQADVVIDDVPEQGLTEAELDKVFS